MKKNLAGLEVHYLVKELQFLIDAKVDKIYAEEKKLVIVFHLPSVGKRIFYANVPSFMVLAKEKPALTCSEFGLMLRKNLNNARLRGFTQKGFERIVEFEFETKDYKRKLILELFSKGNVVLCDEEYQIIAVQQFQRWKDRTVMVKETYVNPTKEYNFLTFKVDDLKKMLAGSTQTLVKSLAIDLGLGGVYAEEACILAEVDKNTDAKDFKEFDKLFKALKSLRNKAIKANVVNDGKDVVPFSLEFYSGLDVKGFDTFYSALDDHFSKFKEVKQSKYEQQIDKVQVIIDEQKKQIARFESSEVEAREKADALYAKYQEMSSILKELNLILEKHSWKEVKEKLKGHKVIKDVNAKEKSIVVEL